MKNTEVIDAGKKGCLVSRRQFLWGSGTALATMTIMIQIPGCAQPQKAMMAKYPRMKIGQLSQLKTDQPAIFNYPDKGKHSGSLLIKLGVPAGGGVGAGRDVVAFNAVCVHQGGPLIGSYKAEHKALGACPLHLSTYDLTRHGILISGQAYQGLPQVLLEIQGDDIFAVGMMGLIFGRNENIQS